MLEKLYKKKIWKGIESQKTRSRFNMPACWNRRCRQRFFIWVFRRSHWNSWGDRKTKSHDVMEFSYAVMLYRLDRNWICDLGNHIPVHFGLFLLQLIIIWCLWTNSAYILCSTAIKLRCFICFSLGMNFSPPWIWGNQTSHLMGDGHKHLQLRS